MLKTKTDNKDLNLNPPAAQAGGNPHEHLNFLLKDPAAKHCVIPTLISSSCLRTQLQRDNLNALWASAVGGQEARIGNCLHGGAAKIRIASFSSNTDGIPSGASVIRNVQRLPE